MTQSINLANFSNSLDSSGQVSPNALNSAVPISKGGTGATTSAAAAAALGPQFALVVGTYLFPVGSIYTNASNATNPATLLGFGTWVAFGQGRVTLGAGTGGGSTYTAGTTSGNKDSTGLPNHTHSASFSGNALPTHAHTMALRDGPGSNAQHPGHADGPIWSYFTTDAVSAGTPSGTVSVSTTTFGVTDANMMPYIVVYMWQRTA